MRFHLIWLVIGSLMYSLHGMNGKKAQIVGYAGNMFPGAEKVNASRSGFENIEVEDEIFNVHRVLRKAKKAAAAVRPDLLSKYQEKEQARQLSAQQLLENQIRAQNTLLVATPEGKGPFRVGFYKRDYVEGAALLASVGVDILLYRDLKQHLIELTVKHVADNIDEYRKHLSDIKQANKKDRDKYIARFKQFLKKRGNLSFNPLNKAFFVKELPWLPFLKHFILKNTIRFAEQKFIVHRPEFSYFLPEYGYIKKGHELMQLESSPVSVVTLAKLLLLPTKLFELPFSMQFNDKPLLYYLNELTAQPAPTEGNPDQKKYLFPPWIFNNGVQFAARQSIHFFTMLLAATFFNNYCENIWQEACIKHSSAFLKVLEEYRAAENKNISDASQVVESIEVAKKSLQKFIQDCYQPVSIFPWKQWSVLVNKINITRFLTSLGLTLSITSYLGYKFYKAIHN